MIILITMQMTTTLMISVQTRRSWSPVCPPLGKGDARLRSGARDGDWMCPGCNNHNYAQRVALHSSAQGSWALRRLQVYKIHVL